MIVEDWWSNTYGNISVATIDDKLCCVEFGHSSLIEKRFPKAVIQPGHSWDTAYKAVMAVEQGKVFDEPLNLIGTDFQKLVWLAVQRIPMGQTVTYKEVAQEIGKPKAIRAVASAIARNPLAVIIPCHRVVGQSNPDAYHWGGSIKRKLLDREYHAAHPMEIVLS